LHQTQQKYLQDELLSFSEGAGVTGLNLETGAGFRAVGTGLEPVTIDPRTGLGLVRGELKAHGVRLVGTERTLRGSLGSHGSTFEVSSIARISRLVFADFLTTCSCNLLDGAADRRIFVCKTKNKLFIHSIKFIITEQK